MATFGQVIEQIQTEQRLSPADRIRRRYLKNLHELTGRNVVAYYSGWLQKQGPENFSNVAINDEDKHGFMAAFAGLDFSKGLDLILHTPGGDVAATESIIDYLRSKFERNIRVIVPQISMSGGTMIALAANEIVMGRHSNLGPIDPQIGNRPAIAILKEFEQARDEILADQRAALLWAPILQQYGPTLLSFADHAIKWTQEIGLKTLREGLFFGDPQADAKAADLVNFLISHDLHRAHGRHLHRTELTQRGLNITDLEADNDLQDAVLSVHHACMITVGNTAAAKLIENHLGIAHVKVVGQIQIPMQVQMPQVPIPMPAPMAPVPPMPAAPIPPTPADPSTTPPVVETSPTSIFRRIAKKRFAKKSATSKKRAAVKKVAVKRPTSRKAKARSKIKRRGKAGEFPGISNPDEN